MTKDERRPFQVLVLLFRWATSGQPEFAVFRRSDNGLWQGIAGGGEAGETPRQAAVRETFEESGVAVRKLYRLDTTASVPARFFPARAGWAPDVFVVPEIVFAADAGEADIVLSDEHSTVVWQPFDVAASLLHFDSNRTAILELSERLSTHQLKTSRERNR